MKSCIEAVPFVAENPSQHHLNPTAQPAEAKDEWEEWHSSRAPRGPRGPLRPLSLASSLTGSAFTAQSAPTARRPSAGKLASALIVTARWESCSPTGTLNVATAFLPTCVPSRHALLKLARRSLYSQRLQPTQQEEFMVQAAQRKSALPRSATDVQVVHAQTLSHGDINNCAWYCSQCIWARLQPCLRVWTFAGAARLGLRRLDAAFAQSDADLRGGESQR